VIAEQVGVAHHGDPLWATGLDSHGFYSGPSKLGTWPGGESSCEDDCFPRSRAQLGARAGGDGAPLGEDGGLTAVVTVLGERLANTTTDAITGVVRRGVWANVRTCLRWVYVLGTYRNRGLAWVRQASGVRPRRGRGM
jgi:hypothetical protein